MMFTDLIGRKAVEKFQGERLATTSAATLETNEVKSRNLSLPDRMRAEMVKRGLINEFVDLLQFEEPLASLEFNQVEQLRIINYQTISIQLENRHIEIKRNELIHKITQNHIEQLEQIQLAGGKAREVTGLSYIYHQNAFDLLRPLLDSLSNEEKAVLCPCANNCDLVFFFNDQSADYLSTVADTIFDFLAEAIVDPTLSHYEKKTLLINHGLKNKILVNGAGNLFYSIGFGTGETRTNILLLSIRTRPQLFKHEISIPLVPTIKDQRIKYLHQRPIGSIHSFALRLTKRLDADQIDTIDFRGLLRLYCYFTEGWLCARQDVEDQFRLTLIEKFQSSAFSSHFNKILLNQLDENPQSALCFAYNLSTSLASHPSIVAACRDTLRHVKTTGPAASADIPEKGLNVYHKLRDAFIHAPFPLLKSSLEIQSFILFVLGLHKSHECLALNLTDNGGPLVWQASLPGLPKSFLKIDCNLSASCENFLQNLQEGGEAMKWIEPLFAALWELIPQEQAPIEDIDTPWEAIIGEGAFESVQHLCASPTPSVRRCGGYLMAALYLATGNRNYIPLLLQALVDTAQNESEDGCQRLLSTCHSLLTRQHDGENEALSSTSAIVRVVAIGKMLDPQLIAHHPHVMFAPLCTMMEKESPDIHTLVDAMSLFAASHPGLSLQLYQRYAETVSPELKQEALTALIGLYRTHRHAHQLPGLVEAAHPVIENLHGRLQAGSSDLSWLIEEGMKLNTLEGFQLATTAISNGLIGLNNRAFRTAWLDFQKKEHSLTAQDVYAVLKRSGAFDQRELSDWNKSQLTNIYREIHSQPTGDQNTKQEILKRLRAMDPKAAARVVGECVTISLEQNNLDEAEKLLKLAGEHKLNQNKHYSLALNLFEKRLHAAECRDECDNYASMLSPFNKVKADHVKSDEFKQLAFRLFILITKGRDPARSIQSFDNIFRMRCIVQTRQDKKWEMNLCFLALEAYHSSADLNKEVGLLGIAIQTCLKSLKSHSPEKQQDILNWTTCAIFKNKRLMEENRDLLSPYIPQILDNLNTPLEHCMMFLMLSQCGLAPMTAPRIGLLWRCAGDVLSINALQAIAIAEETIQTLDQKLPPPINHEDIPVRAIYAQHLLQAQKPKEAAQELVLMRKTIEDWRGSLTEDEVACIRLFCAQGKFNEAIALWEKRFPKSDNAGVLAEILEAYATRDPRAAAKIYADEAVLLAGLPDIHQVVGHIIKRLLAEDGKIPGREDLIISLLEHYPITELELWSRSLDIGLLEKSGSLVGRMVIAFQQAEEDARITRDADQYPRLWIKLLKAAAEANIIITGGYFAKKAFFDRFQNPILKKLAASFAYSIILKQSLETNLSDQFDFDLLYKRLNAVRDHMDNTFTVEQRRSFYCIFINSHDPDQFQMATRELLELAKRAYIKDPAITQKDLISLFMVAQSRMVTCGQMTTESFDNIGLVLKMIGSQRPIPKEMATIIMTTDLNLEKFVFSVAELAGQYIAEWSSDTPADDELATAISKLAMGIVSNPYSNDVKVAQILNALLDHPNSIKFLSKQHYATAWSTVMCNLLDHISEFTDTSLIKTELDYCLHNLSKIVGHEDAENQVIKRICIMITRIGTDLNDLEMYEHCIRHLVFCYTGHHADEMLDDFKRPSDELPILTCEGAALNIARSYPNPLPITSQSDLPKEEIERQLTRKQFLTGSFLAAEQQKMPPSLIFYQRPSKKAHICGISILQQRLARVLYNLCFTLSNGNYSNTAQYQQFKQCFQLPWQTLVNMDNGIEKLIDTITVNLLKLKIPNDPLAFESHMEFLALAMQQIKVRSIQKSLNISAVAMMLSVFLDFNVFIPYSSLDKEKSEIIKDVDCFTGVIPLICESQSLLAKARLLILFPRICRFLRIPAEERLKIYTDMLNSFRDVFNEAIAGTTLKDLFAQSIVDCISRQEVNSIKQKKEVVQLLTQELLGPYLQLQTAPK